MNFKIKELGYYFDSQVKNRLDQGFLGRKSGQILQLREKLMALPEDQFEVTFKSIDSLVTAHTPMEKDTPTQTAQERAAKELYERTTSHVDSRIDEIRAI